jgi:DNA polymerase III sliding clamp (beta) subunit (PCNA family)
MLADLKFVQGAVAKKDFLPALTHFCIENGTVRGYNGTIALCSPIPFDIACKPKAETLVRAIGNCADTVQLSLTPAGRLSVKSGSFKTFIDCVDGETPHLLPTGQRVEVNGVALLAGLKAVQAFIGEDASRAWCNGVLLKGGSMFATNNVTLVEFWAGSTLPIVANLPRTAVRELIRIGEPPSHAQYDETSVTFHYEGRRWLRTQLLPADWPDLSRVLDQPCTPQPVDSRIFEALEVIKPFADKLGRVLFQGGSMCTHEAEGEGASYAVDGLAVDGVYNIEMLELLQGVAVQVDFTTYPKPCLFFGENIRGAIIGMRK